MLIDLSHPITNSLPVYPGDPAPQVMPLTSLENDGYYISTVTMGTHTGTHIDAPIHMVPNGKRLEDYPLERFILPAVCFDVRQGFDSEAIAAGLSQPGLGVLFYTGVSDYFNEERYWHEYPTIPVKVQQLLISKKVSLAGIDAGSFDSEEDFPVHKALLGADILLIECLTNLMPLVNKEFELIALPLKLEADGAPVRALARLD